MIPEKSSPRPTRPARGQHRTGHAHAHRRQHRRPPDPGRLHYHFFEANPALRFDRAAARGFRLNIPAGTAVRFEAGDTKEMALVALAGAREVFGLNAKSTPA